jgi:hypothetical protein
MGDGSPLAAALIVGRGSRGGSTSSSVVIVDEGDPSERRALRVLRLWPSHGSEGSPLSSNVCLIGGERGANPALEAARPMVSTLPWTMSALRAEIGSSGGSGDSWWSVQPADGGWRPMDLVKKVIDMHAPREIGGAQHTYPVTQVDGR